MVKRGKPARQFTGLYYAREACGMSRSELVRRSGVSKQQLSRLENGLIRLRLDHLLPFAPHLGYSPEQILLWGRFPGTEGPDTDTQPARSAPKELTEVSSRGVPELDGRRNTSEGAKRNVRRDGRHTEPLKDERWIFPDAFLRNQLHTSAENLLVIESDGDSMAPTIASGERVIIDLNHRTPSPDGLYAIRDTFGAIIVRRLQVLRSSRPTRVRVIADNSKHPSEETPLNELEIVGRALCCLKLF
jgi:phage repressor protein C with HTH and peptisase S24 domain/DNA-binding XRE family transcriptional regulator